MGNVESFINILMPECFIKSGWTCTKTSASSHPSSVGRFGWRFLVDLGNLDLIPCTHDGSKGLVYLPAKKPWFTMKSNQMYIGKYTIPMHPMGYGKGTRHPSFLETQCFFPRPLGTLRRRWSDGVLLPAMGGYFHHEFWITGSLWLYQLYLSRYLCNVWLCIYLSLHIYISYGCTGIPTIGYISCFL